MSDKTNQKKESEEVDLLQLFNFFESKVKSLLKILFKILESIFNVFINFLKILQANFIKISISVIVAFVVGTAYDMYRPKVFKSKMMVKPMYNSKYQLFTNIDYYNALIRTKAIDKLSKVFEITTEEAKSLKGFEMTPGPENENEKIRAYDDFIKSLDSSTAKMVDYEQFIDQMSVYNSSLYEIKVRSSQKDIFLKLLPGFTKTFETEYSKENKKKQEEIYELKRKSILSSLKSVDSLKSVYVNTLTGAKESRVETIAGQPVIVGEEQVKTKEYELLNLEIRLRNNLSALEEEAIEQKKLFEVISGFQAIGTAEIELLKKMKVILPIATFILMFLGIFGLRFNKFVANYKS